MAIVVTRVSAAPPGLAGLSLTVGGSVIVEVNEAGGILIPAELVQAPPHTRLEADRDGDAVVLKPIAEKPPRGTNLIGSLPVLEGRLADPGMTFRREDIYGSDGR